MGDFYICIFELQGSRQCTHNRPQLNGQPRTIARAHGFQNLRGLASITHGNDFLRQFVPAIILLGGSTHTRSHQHGVRFQQLFLSLGIQDLYTMFFHGKDLGRTIGVHRFIQLADQVAPMDVGGILGKSILHFHDGHIVPFPSQSQALFAARQAAANDDHFLAHRNIFLEQVRHMVDNGPVQAGNGRNDGFCATGHNDNIGLFGTNQRLVDLRVKPQLQIGGTLDFNIGTDTELCESTQTGDVAFFLGSTAFTANFVPELNVIDLPFLYADSQQFRDTMDDEEVFNFYKEKYTENNFQLIGFFDQGMRQMTSNTKVQSPEDMHGQKIRVMENQLHIAIWEALGASPTPMAFSEVYMALQQGTIDAQENPFEVIYANRIYEQQDYVIMTSHLAASHNLLFSKVVYDGLSETDQALIMAVGEAAIQYAREQCDARLDERMALVEEAGCEIVELSPEVLQELRDLCSGIYDDVRATYGDEQVDMQINAAEKYA